MDGEAWLPDEAPTARTVVGSPKRCRRHQWNVYLIREGVAYDPPIVACEYCGKPKDEALSRRGKQSRNYGNRAELDVARRYGGEKIGHAGGPVEWTTAFAKMAASTDRLPRLLLRFVRPGNAPEDYFVVPAKAWLDWHGKDE